MHVRQLLTASCGIIARQYYLLQCWFSIRKINGFAGNVLSIMTWDLRSFGTYAAQNGNSYHHCPAWPFSRNVRGSYQKFCTLYVFSLKMNLFDKIHLQAFNVISIVLYHSGPTFGQVLYSFQDAFIVDASDYSDHLIRHLLSASEAFPTEWFLQYWEKVKVWWAHVRTVWRVGKHLPSILFQNFRYCTWGMTPRIIVQNEEIGCEHGGTFWRIFGCKTPCRNFL